MDEQKDVTKTDSISRFIDGHHVRTNPFGENRAGDRAYRRAERIAAALHLLTKHIDDNEPVTKSLKLGSIELLEQILQLRDEMRANQSSSFVAAQSKIRHLISLIRVLTVSGRVSIQNASIMVEALDELGNFLTVSQRSMMSESVTVSREDLLDLRGGSLKSTGPSSATKDIKDSITVTETKSVTATSVMTNNTAESNGHVSARSRNIIDVLRTGGMMGIKDVCANLPEYSEKMIQRELAELVEAGQVKKIGLKRWSKYSIAS
ncbi:MAG: hypothetical protein JO019_01965 [Candidatus Kaiserbacteria bacterium]|nr:hypothetical protein [Candidatus Kaiserbacteria bacterium]